MISTPAASNVRRACADAAVGHRNCEIGVGGAYPVSIHHRALGKMTIGNDHYASNSRVTGIWASSAVAL